MNDLPTRAIFLEKYCRWFWAAALVTLLVGCRDAEAIYKDEVAKLETLKRDWAKQKEAARVESLNKTLEAQRREINKLRKGLEDEFNSKGEEWSTSSEFWSRLATEVEPRARANVASKSGPRKKVLEKKLAEIKCKFEGPVSKQERRVTDCYVAKEAAK